MCVAYLSSVLITGDLGERVDKRLLFTTGDKDTEGERPSLKMTRVFSRFCDLCVVSVGMHLMSQSLTCPVNGGADKD